MSNKQAKINQKIKDLRNKINNLDRSRIHVLFFEYNFSFKNLYHSPLLFLTTKPLALITGKKSIDHVAHISRFDLDEYRTENSGIKQYNAKLFEANVERGMEENWLIDRLKQIDAKVYILTLGEVDKKKAKLFEKKYKGQPYSKNAALFAGLDLFFMEESKGNYFCSWLVAEFLKDQKYFEGNSSEVTPSDLFEEFKNYIALFHNSRHYV